MDAVSIRTSVLAKAQSSLAALDGVDAIFLSGSLVEGTDDRYSDIDLRVLVSDTAYESVVALREQLPMNWGPFLFHETVGPNLTVSYYDSLTKVDVFYYASSTFAPSPWLSLGTRILLDRTGHLTQLLEASKGLKFDSSFASVMGHLEKCLASLIECAKRFRRGERIYASRLCAEAVHHLLAGDDLLAGRAPFGSSKRERRVPGKLTDVAKASLELPTMAVLNSYLSRLGASLRNLVSRAVEEGLCTHGDSARLLSAIDQMILIAGDRE